MKKKLLAYSILVFALTIAFTNCGPGFISGNHSSSGFGSFSSYACEDILQQAYATTYFPVLSTSCNRCHSDSHGSLDFQTSYQAFITKSAATIDYKASQPHGDNGLNMTNQITSLRPAWDLGQQDYLNCVSFQESQTVVNSTHLKLNSKTIAGIAETQANPSRWKTVEWDIENEVRENQVGQFAAFLKIEARFALKQGAIIGIEFRNPTIRLKATGKNLAINSLAIYLDGKLQSDVTTYLDVATIITVATDTLLVTNGSNALAYYPAATENTKVALKISGIQFVNSPVAIEIPSRSGQPPVLPVTFAQLISTDPELGIFRTNCIGCHSGANASAGLDLSNYVTAKDRASSIIARMNDAARPMPQSGLLSSAQRGVVSRWINSGTPQ